MFPARGLPWNTVVVVVVVVTSKVRVRVPAWVPCLPEFPTSHDWEAATVSVRVVTTVSTHCTVDLPIEEVVVHCGTADAVPALSATTRAMIAPSVSSKPIRFIIVSSLLLPRILLLLGISVNKGKRKSRG
jgi:hypothetical protein